MDEQTTPTLEPTTTTTPDPVVVDTPIVEPPQAEPRQALAEPISTPPEMAQTPIPDSEATTEQPEIQPVSEPIEIPPETPTAQMGRNEPLPETAPEPASQGALGPQGSLPFSKTEARQENLVAPEVTAPTPPQTQQGTVQPEPTPTPVPEPMPAQAQTVTPPQNIVGLILTKARAVIQLRKQKKLAKIMALFAKQTSITNDEVEKLLHVSDSTATRYLSELEKQGKITQSGKTGHAVTYTKR